MQIHEIQRQHKNKTQTRVGRGGKRGKTSGHGHKGQKARAGHKIRPEIRDEMKRQPKLRGRGSNRFLSHAEKPQIVNLDTLAEVFASGETVNPETLKEKNIIRFRKGSSPDVKVLARGDITKKITVSGCSVSHTAREKIEKAGGTVK